MDNQTRTLIGLTTIFLILIALSLAIYFNSRDLDCDKCQIEFKNTEIFGMKLEQPIVIQVNVTDIYSELKEDHCIIRRSRSQGYYYGS